MQCSHQKQSTAATCGALGAKVWSPSLRRSTPRRSSIGARIGFTLVELLVVIAIIGILIGMLAVSIGPVLTRVHDGAVTTEMKQLELAVENFNNQYGFYPPSFAGFPKAVAPDPVDPHASDSSVTDAEAAQLLPFLNKISANHRELSPMPGDSAGRSRLRVWWTNIGRHLDNRSSLVFWLSGLCSNKQFPLTGGLEEFNNMPQLPSAFGLNQAVVVTADGNRNVEQLATKADGSLGPIPRDSFFDFRGGQLGEEAFDFATLTSPELPAGIRVYNTPFGDGRPDRGNEYQYRDHTSYNTTGDAFFALDETNQPRFVNPDTFQIYTFGRDGLAANEPLNEVDGPLGEVNRDNITNFANGRLEVFDWRSDLGIEP